MTNPPVIINLDQIRFCISICATFKRKKTNSFNQAFSIIIRFEGFSHQLKAGVYQVKPGETAMQLLHRVASRRCFNTKFYNYCRHDPTENSSRSDKSTLSGISSRGLDVIKENHPNAEGLLLADTYQYRGGSSSKTLLEHAHRNLLNYLNHAGLTERLIYLIKLPYELLNCCINN